MLITSFCCRSWTTPRAWAERSHKGRPIGGRGPIYSVGALPTSRSIYLESTAHDARNLSEQVFHGFLSARSAEGEPPHERVCIPGSPEKSLGTTVNLSVFLARVEPVKLSEMLDNVIYTGHV